MNISIIIPTLNEESALDRQLAVLQAYPGLEIIVADGGSTDHTMAVAKRQGIKTITSPPGRGTQQNMGAKAASGEILLFLHCDTRLPDHFAAQVHTVLNLPGTAAGAFKLRIDASGPGYRIVEWGVNLRSKKLQMVYGDQAIFVRKNIFYEAGAFADQSILEDVELVSRLKRLGRIRLVPDAVTTSARRWQRLGLIRTTLLNQIMLGGYLLNIDPDRLARLYYKRP